MRTERENKLYETFKIRFGCEPAQLYSAPGRTELGGNHTDHQHGLVLASAVDLDSIGWCDKNDSLLAAIDSEGYPPFEVDLSDLSIHPEETGTSAALVRGIAAWMKENGASVGGFCMASCSSVLKGSGLSSSASFELLLATAMNGLFCDGRFSPLDLAKAGQFAENKYYGKPSGMMDQVTVSFGGILNMDFEDTSAPKLEQVDFDFASCGYKICIVDCGADHSDLTGEYAAIPQELTKVCSLFGKQWLRQIPEKEFFSRLPEVRKACGDRALLRAIHVYEENNRVLREVEALKRGDFKAYLHLVRASGDSSWKYLQNVIPCGYKEHQEMAAALAVSRHLLGDQGVCRVQGGGFAGAIQVYVPDEQVPAFKEGIEAFTGKGSCSVISLRKEGAMRIDKIF